VPDADQALGQDVDEKRRRNSSAEIVITLCLLPVHSPSIGRDAVILEADQAMVGDGDAVGVAGQVLENVFRSAERRLGIDDPILHEELSQETPEAFRCCEFLKRAMELELALEQKLLEFRGDLATEDAAQNTNGQKEREEATIHREPSRARPPPGTTQWTWG